MSNATMIENAERLIADLEEHIKVSESKGIACGEERVLLKKLKAFTQYHK